MTLLPDSTSTFSLYLRGLKETEKKALVFQMGEAPKHTMKYEISLEEDRDLENN